MEAFLYTTVSFCLFLFGVGLGGIIEHRRAKLLDEIKESRRHANESIAPVLHRIEQNTEERLRKIQGTLTDLEAYNRRDPEATLEIPRIINDD
jgi:hypothetical protein